MRNLIVCLQLICFTILTAFAADSFPTKGIYVAHDSNYMLVFIVVEKQAMFTIYGMQDRRWKRITSLRGKLEINSNRASLGGFIGLNEFAFEAPIDQNGVQQSQIVQINSEEFPPAFGISLPSGRCFRPFIRVDVPPEP